MDEWEVGSWKLEVGSGETAIIMSILLPHYIWIATESNGNFKFQILIPFKKEILLRFLKMAITLIG
jgi:hypothetical protein